MSKYLVSVVLGIILFTSCQSQKSKINTSFSEVPEWSQNAIWYQIFVERFRNGDPTNDPTPRDLYGAYPDTVPANWAITPWGTDWYKPDSWFSETGLKNFSENIQLRRYGGDLQGVIDKLDYLSDLGINAIYFNPLNDAPSLHKYDPRYWHHIDRNFGPNPDGDIAIIATETPSDPSTWKYTHADSLFLKVISECHKRGIRLIMDYSWNHTGMDFWALNDVRKSGLASEFADWYHINSFDDTSTLTNEFSYKGWYNIKYLPELQKDIVGQDTLFPFEGNLKSQTAKNHIFSVTRRWLDPNGDGNPSDGIDGYRLDVAAEIPKGFWPEFRKVVRSVNPEAYLIGEVWWQSWPDLFMDPRQFLQGDMFDAVMNYHWYRPACQFFTGIPSSTTPLDFADSLAALQNGISEQNYRAMMNLTSSHDSPRTLTALYNKNRYKYNAKPFDDSTYKIDKPDSASIQSLKMLLVHQYSFIGAPHIWYGDEVGMWGADDPDTRKPMLWSDMVYEDEVVHPLGLPRPVNQVKPDTALRQFYKLLISVRKQNPALVFGDLKIELADSSKNILLYSRNYEGETVLACFNVGYQTQEVVLTLKHNYKDVVDLCGSEIELKKVHQNLQLIIPARSATLVKLKQ